jgi:hypothetical protein
MGVFNIFNIKWKIIIMLIIVQKQLHFQHIKTFSWLHVIFLTMSSELFTLPCLHLLITCNITIYMG